MCWQHGSLAVPNGRSIVPVINTLLSWPFTLTVATQDWHPPDHVSFASNHPDPNSKPFESFAIVPNPKNPSETFRTRLWPVHCVQGTAGAELLPELCLDKVQHIVRKGQDARIEMYSAVRDPYRTPSISESVVSDLLRASKITHVFVVGLAMDYCVKHTALDCHHLGFHTFVIHEATMAVDAGDAGWGASQRELERAGVSMISLTGAELNQIRPLP